MPRAFPWSPKYEEFLRLLKESCEQFKPHPDFTGMIRAGTKDGSCLIAKRGYNREVCVFCPITMVAYTNGKGVFSVSETEVGEDFGLTRDQVATIVRAADIYQTQDSMPDDVIAVRQDMDEALKDWVADGK